MPTLRIISRCGSANPAADFHLRIAEEAVAATELRHGSMEPFSRAVLRPETASCRVIRSSWLSAGDVHSRTAAPKEARMG